MNRRTFLQAAGATTPFELPALAAEAEAADSGRCRSFVRSLPAPAELSAGSGYAFEYATDGRAVDDRLPAADAYGTLVAPEARVTVALEPEKRRTSDLVGPDRDPDARHAGRPLFADGGRTRHRVLVPGRDVTVFAVGPARPSVTSAATALLDGLHGVASTYYEESDSLRRLLDRLGSGTSLAAVMGSRGRAPDVVAGGRRVAVRDGAASVRSVALFESASAARSPDATARATEAVPAPDVPADGATTVRRTGRAVVRETTRPRAELTGGEASG